jgi:hypothetical protein
MRSITLGGKINELANIIKNVIFRPTGYQNRYCSELFIQVNTASVPPIKTVIINCQRAEVLFVLVNILRTTNRIRRKIPRWEGLK